MKTTEVIMFILMIFFGFYAIKYKSEYNIQKQKESSLDSLILNQKEKIKDLRLKTIEFQNLRENCYKCSKYPIYELD